MNTTYSPNFEIGWAHHVIGVSVAATTFVMSDVLIATITINITLQFKILQKILRDTFKHLGINDRDDETVSVTDSSKKWKTLRTEIKKIVIHHLSLIDLVGNLEAVSSVLLLIGVISGLSITSFSLYYASVLPLLDFTALQSYFEVLATIVPLFVVCYCGNELSKSSEYIANMCYKINFIGTDIKFQKSLLLIMMRSQKPVRLTIGKFAGISIEIFTWVSKPVQQPRHKYMNINCCSLCVASIHTLWFYVRVTIVKETLCTRTG
ncbi:hypothetical protein ILUMI_10422 [Ignelater luminosus]|uniref:Uncharacterized protein n=1 Tax=Ignelater luminosus TaxID=2038154 RepID=A0A8K0GDN1_IGNLU|nr:hypothetical protein ILUMI_10422 [Ignelater luminosus]